MDTLLNQPVQYPQSDLLLPEQIYPESSSKLSLPDISSFNTNEMVSLPGSINFINPIDPNKCVSPVYYESSFVGGPFPTSLIDLTTPSSEENLTPEEIKKIAKIFGYNLGGSYKDQMNMIRNRLGFEGVAERENFEEAEIQAILNYFNIPSYLPSIDQMAMLKEKINLESPSLGSPTIGNSSPGSPSFNSISPLQNVHRFRTPHFNLIELQKISQLLGLSYIGNEETLIQNIRSILN